MFGMGSIGNFLPMLGSIGSGFGGGGLLSLGFTLLSGLITNIGSPRNPGFENFASHPGFNNNDVHPGFGTMGGGPNAATVGSAAGYFGNAYSSDYSILPQTPSGQYYGNAGYSYGNHGVTYSPNQPVSYSNHHYGNSVTNLQFGGNFGGYMDSYNSVVLPQAPFFPSYQHGHTHAMYGSAPAPYQQSYSPVMNHYGFGSPQQYNPAATLYGHQNGSVKMTYGQPHYNTTYGGPQGGDKVVHHHHHHHVHLHVHEQEAQNPPADGQNKDYGKTTETPTENKTAYTKPETKQPKTETEQKYSTATDYTDTETDVAYESPKTPKAPEIPTNNYQPQVPDPDCPPGHEPNAYAPEPQVQAPGPFDQIGFGGMSAAGSTAQAVTAHQTTFGRVPHVNTDAEWGQASRAVAERITGGDSGQYHFGGRDPRVNWDGMGPERNAVWHVFQQNETLRFDASSGQFYETKSDGSKVDMFHISSVSSIERQAGGDHRYAFEMVGDFLNNRGLGAPNMNVGVGTTNVRTPESTIIRQPVTAPGFG